MAKPEGIIPGAGLAGLAVSTGKGKCARAFTQISRDVRWCTRPRSGLVIVPELPPRAGTSVPYLFAYT